MIKYYSSECPVLASTDGVSYEIAVAGCHFHCKGCQNPELQDHNAGKDLTPSLITELLIDINKYRAKIDNIDIIGGEPLDQPTEDLYEFLMILKSNFPELGIWIYTGYEINQVPLSIIMACDYIKCGQYEENLRDDKGYRSDYGPYLITSNQYIIKCDEELERRGINVRINSKK